MFEDEISEFCVISEDCYSTVDAITTLRESVE